MCGIVGMIAPDSFPVVERIYDGLIAIQHRGQDAAGIVTWDGRYHLVKRAGLVRDVFHPGNVCRLTGSWGIGQVRYPTTGAGGVEDAQPFVTDHPFGIAMVHNGQVTNFTSLRGELEKRNHRYVDSANDVEIILHVFAHALASRKAAALEGNATLTFEDVQHAARAVFRRVEGAYAAIGLIAGRGLVAFRDPYGIRPILLGRRDTEDGPAYALASESVVLDLAGFEIIDDLAPGEVVFVDTSGQLSRAVIYRRGHCPCVFEHIYFARPDSMIDDISVHKTRMRLGELLAHKWQRTTDRNVDVVIPVPDSARHAALAMARALNVKYREGLVKNRYVGRTFIMPGTTDRRRAIRAKLNAIRLEFEGKDVLLVDDSIVRGNTVREIIRIAREAGARHVYFASYSAPLVSPCIYGIDMSTRHDFIARERPIAEIAKIVDADELVYQDQSDMLSAAREGNSSIESFCDACFTGRYPAGPVSAETLALFEKDRAQVNSTAFQTTS